MNLLIPEITDAIITTLKDQVKTVSKSNISAKEEASKSLPRILISSPEFTVEEAGIAGSEPERRVLCEDRLSGDGRTIDFDLSQKPLRPLVTLQHPLGEIQRETEDYSVDYPAGKIRFRSAPAKGKGNVVVKYYGAKSAAELRSLQLNLKYLVEVCAKSTPQRDEVTVEALRALLIVREAVERQGIIFRILGGRNVDLNQDDTGDKDATSKQIECIAQTKLLAEIPLSAMEKIIIERHEWNPLTQ